MIDYFDELLKDCPLPKGHLSVSQINDYLACPARYRFRNIDQINVPRSAPIVYGTAWDRVLTANYEQKIETGVDLPIDELQDRFAESIEEQAQMDVDWGDESKDSQKDHGTKALAEYMKTIAPTIQPKAVQVRVEPVIADNQFIGFIDVETVDGKIIDHKTTTKTPSDPSIEFNLQATVYSMGYRDLHGEDEQVIEFHFLVRNKTPKFVIKKTTRETRDYGYLETITRAVADGIRNERFYPNPTSKYCDRCPFRGVCKETYGKVVSF